MKTTLKKLSISSLFLGLFPEKKLKGFVRKTGYDRSLLSLEDIQGSLCHAIFVKGGVKVYADGTYFAWSLNLGLIPIVVPEKASLLDGICNDEKIQAERFCPTHIVKVINAMNGDTIEETVWIAKISSADKKNINLSFKKLHSEEQN